MIGSVSIRLISWCNAQPCFRLGYNLYLNYWIFFFSPAGTRYRRESFSDAVHHIEPVWTVFQQRFRTDPIVRRSRVHQSLARRLRRVQNVLELRAHNIRSGKRTFITVSWRGAILIFRCIAQNKAKEHDCQQVLWLYGEDDQLTEVGCMSLFLFCTNEEGGMTFIQNYIFPINAIGNLPCNWIFPERELITPPVENGLILRSITRRSILELARDWNEFKVSEKHVTMDDIVRMANENRVSYYTVDVFPTSLSIDVAHVVVSLTHTQLLEMFGAGTACIVNPIGEIYYKRTDSVIPVPTNEQNSPLYARFFQTLTDIQYGRVPHPWAVEVTADDEQLKKKKSSVVYSWNPETEVRVLYNTRNNKIYVSRASYMYETSLRHPCVRFFSRWIFFDLYAIR